MATVAVEVSPGHSVMYPLCPYHAAWKPGSPEGTLAGGGMPGPTLEVHVAASRVAVTDPPARAAPASAGATPSMMAAQIAAKTFTFPPDVSQ